MHEPGETKRTSQQVTNSRSFLEKATHQPISPKIKKSQSKFTQKRQLEAKALKTSIDAS